MQPKMKLALYTIPAIISGASIVCAFTPKSKPLEVKSPFDGFTKRAFDSTLLKSSVAEPLPEQKRKPASTKNPFATVSGRIAVAHKKWGVDNTTPDEYFEETYWADSRIHTLGNLGILGAVHAALAPISTRMIDNVAYEGVDIRKRVAEELSSKYHKQKAKVLDLCCGVGFSTRALVHAFPDAEKIVGVDTSPQMLAMARFISAHVGHLRPWLNTGRSKLSKNYQKILSQGQKMQKDAKSLCATSFTKGNAENVPYKDGSFDVVTIMYAFHEAPLNGRQRILQEARRLLSPGGVLAVIDIATDYEPSPSMLAGEPYVLEYQQNIHKQLGNQKGFLSTKYQTLVPGHVGMWVLRRAPTPA